MKTKNRITLIVMIGMYLSINAQQNKIESTGNVGIGTIAPKALLDVAKTPASYAKPFVLTDGFGKYNFFMEYPSSGQNYLNMYMKNESNTIKVKLTPQGNSYFNGGNVGIGTSDPKHKLDINTGGGNFKTYLYGVEHTVNTAGGWARGFRLRNENDNQTVVFGANSGNAYISTGFDVDVDVTGYQNQKFTINTAGNVGIGTTGPSEKLDVNGNVTITGDLKMSGSDSYIWTNGTGTGYTGIWDQKNKRVLLYTSESTGNIGIGTTDTKGFKLGVNGKVAATEVKIATYANWSDFVFEKSYKLPSLENVEKHIEEKGHLKDIPSAEEVEKNGFFLGEMDAKLLHKIEELTLYTIQQEKKIKASEKMNQKLLILVNKLENRIEKLEKK